MLQDVLVTGWLFLLPAVSLCALRVGFGCSGATLYLANAPVLFIMACTLWLRSELLARRYLRAVGHHCGKRDDPRAAHHAGVSRNSPILPAIAALVLLLCALWHLTAAVLFLLQATGTW
ncbi:hypothetical protein DQ04_01581010 [Trypanosoma grayi]|uniref:hypothetical protein n=1 Tax=Trypanosoma grayi TaxID=71804 RepID=UPI0004F43AE2|nr:hypothetical protein DQ04_01581010 [Trypanosoma grayi]KEG12604.1 hypothetical protein DQ04_01581010 [Trypanosoma grayi]